KLTKKYKSKLSKMRGKYIWVNKKNYNARAKFESQVLIDISYKELKKLSQVKITKGDFDLMCRVISAEAGDASSYKAKELVAETIVNRARTFGGSHPLKSAITARGAFSVVRNGSINRVRLCGETVNAAKDALIKNSHPKNLLFFSAGRYFSWARPYMAVGGNYFCLSR
ncbi:MAG: cell wall hydrolase, partial [bacterium LCO1.1]|nr:cell wall hydrolase [Candidatus Weimeria bifida]